MKLAQKSGEQTQCMIYFFSRKAGFSRFSNMTLTWHLVMKNTNRRHIKRQRQKMCFKRPTCSIYFFENRGFNDIKYGISTKTFLPKISHPHVFIKNFPPKVFNQNFPTTNFHKKTSHQYNDEFAQFTLSSY